MKRLRDNVWVFLGLMLAFSASMLFGIIFGPEHPQIFFWSVMLVFGCVIALYVKTTLKEVVYLIGGMLGLAFYYQVLDSLVFCYLREDALKFIIECIFLAPGYLPLANYFVKMCSKERDETEEKETDL